MPIKQPTKSVEDAFVAACEKGGIEMYEREQLQDIVTLKDENNDDILLPVNPKNNKKGKKDDKSFEFTKFNTPFIKWSELSHFCNISENWKNFTNRWSKMDYLEQGKEKSVYFPENHLNLRETSNIMQSELEKMWVEILAKYIESNLKYPISEVHQFKDLEEILEKIKKEIEEKMKEEIKEEKINESNEEIINLKNYS